MASETQIQQRPLPPVDAWPPDDTEESILGTDLHQTTLTNLRWGINEAAHLNRQPGRPVPWKVLRQIALLGCLRPDAPPTAPTRTCLSIRASSSRSVVH
jgi:hypothetical protein